MRSHRGDSVFEEAQYQRLRTLADSVNDTARMARTTLSLLLLVALYLALILFSSTDENLLRQGHVKIPQMDTGFPVVQSYIFAPLIFLFMHCHALLMLSVLARKVRTFEAAVKEELSVTRDPDARVIKRREYRDWLSSLVFVQRFLNDPNLSAWSKLFASFVTSVIPLALLFLIDLSFVRYQSSYITWKHHSIFLFDLVLVVLFHWKIYGQKVMKLRWWHPTPANGIVAIVIVVVLIFVVRPPSGTEDPKVIWRDSGVSKIGFYNLLDIVTCELSGLGCRYLDISHIRHKEIKKLLLVKRRLLFARFDYAVMENVNFSESQLQGANFQWAKLKKIEFYRANMQKVNFKWAELQEADLQKADLQGANLQKAELQEAKLQNTNFAQAKLQEVNLSKTDLRSMDFSGLELKRVNFSGADLQGANFSNADLEGANLTKANLSRAKLQGTILAQAKLQEVNLSKTDLRSMDFSGLELQGANLSYTYLLNANLSKAKLQEANISHANLAQADFSETNLQGANLSQAYLLEVKLKGANLTQAKLEGINPAHANLTQAKLKGVNLSKMDLRSRDFSGLELQEAILQGADLSGAKLEGTNLRKADLSGADLSKANLREANLSGAKLHGANLSQAKLKGANLSKTDLRSMDLSKLELQGADFSLANLQGANLAEANLEQAKLEGANLENAHFSKTNLRGAELTNAKLQGTNLQKASPSKISKEIRAIFSVTKIEKERRHQIRGPFLSHRVKTTIGGFPPRIRRGRRTDIWTASPSDGWKIDLETKKIDFTLHFAGCWSRRSEASWVEATEHILRVKAYISAENLPGKTCKATTNISFEEWRERQVMREFVTEFKKLSVGEIVVFKLPDLYYHSAQLAHFEIRSSGGKKKIYPIAHLPPNLSAYYNRHAQTVSINVTTDFPR